MDERLSPRRTELTTRVSGADSSSRVSTVGDSAEAAGPEAEAVRVEVLELAWTTGVDGRCGAVARLGAGTEASASMIGRRDRVPYSTARICPVGTAVAGSPEVYIGTGMTSRCPGWMTVERTPFVCIRSETLIPCCELMRPSESPRRTMCSVAVRLASDGNASYSAMNRSCVP